MVDETRRQGFLARAHERIVRRKYEFLLVALAQHLFVPAFLVDLELFSRVVWPLTVVVLGFFSVGIFADRGLVQRRLKNLTSIVVVVFPALTWIVDPSATWMVAYSLSYFLFFAVICAEVLRHLIRPKYIDVDLMLAAICGYLLLLEMSISLMQGLYYLIPGSFNGVDAGSFGSAHLDLVYFCSIVVTSIGLGDITPAHHVTKLATAMVGIIGQLYSVVLVGILISKYASSGPGSERG